MDWSNPFRDVLRDELDRFGENAPRRSSLDPVIQRAHDARMAGIAFSGGGIRSATFNLGVLQALADLRLLEKFHYLSTVSGGGYIGSWFVAWIHRRGGNLNEVACALRTAWSEHLSERGPEEIRFLRRFSNYLTPKLGWFGADTWTVVAIYLRNVLLNMTTLVAALAFVLMLPRLVGGLIGLPVAAGTGLFSFSALSFVGLLAVAAGFVGWNVFFLRSRERDLWSGQPLNPDNTNVQELISKKQASAVLQREVISFPKDSSDQFKDFVLDLEFKREKENAVSSLTIREDPHNAMDKAKWVIQIGEGVTGDIDESEARPAHLQPVGGEVSDCLRVVCVGQNCTVRLNGNVVNVSRPRGPVRASGRIVLRQSAGKPGITVNQLLIRPLRKVPGPSRQDLVQILIVLPLLLAGVISIQWLGQPELLSRLLGVPPFWSVWFDGLQWCLWAAVSAALLLIALTIELFAGVRRWYKKRGKPSSDSPSLPAKTWGITCLLGQAFWGLIAIVIGGAVGGLALAAFHRALPAPDNFWPRLILGPPAFIVAVSMMLILFIGLRGHHLSEALREWWSRLGAWLLIYSLLWVGLFGVALYSPPVLHWLAANVKPALAALSFGWVTTTISGLFASTSAKTGKRTVSRWREMLVAIAPYVFIVGLLATLAWGINGIISPTTLGATSSPSPRLPFGVNVSVQETVRSAVEVKVSRDPKRGPSLDQTLTAHWQAMTAAHPGLRLRTIRADAIACFAAVGSEHVSLGGNCRLLLLLVGAAAVAGLLGWRIDINDFSMHMMYRNRLARCYLGASNGALRNPHAFTGFDQNDDIALADLAKNDWKCDNSGPFPIINCSLNLVGSRELAWQQRKAASFVFTPGFCGYDFGDLPPGYCPTTRTKESSLPPYAASRTPLTLATAMAISGAAASPNMGYHTSAAAAFLMTLFNVRLGWWIGNPRSERGWQRSAPSWPLARLVAEMFGLTHAEGRYIYLSDGGHFENLGIFELVRRRCRFIVACDAEEDGDFEFEGLGNAIEKCRTDLGVDIDLDVEAIRQRDERGHSRWHCAVGRIRYDRTDEEAHAGTLLYLKSSLSGDEPSDVLRYAARNDAFPHESTSDQWFGESQFESYRALGHHVLMSVFHPVDEVENLSALTTERLFVNLAQRWYPPSAPLDPAFQRRGETLNELYETLRTDRNLRFLSQQIYSGWRGLVEGVKAAPIPTPQPDPWLPETYRELRSGFYFCNRLILLMEDVFHDLHLEREHSHPDNRGWMNLFRHWSWSRMFRVTWTISAANCGARFQNFCARHLGLEVGRMELKEEPLDTLMETAEQPAESPLTFVEWQSLRTFFTQYPELLSESQLMLVRLLPNESEGRGLASLEKTVPEFTAGFALLRKAPTGEEGRRLIYFRIRDHMRRMGMARRAIYRLLAGGESIALELKPMPEGALQQNEEDSQTEFQDLYRGVQIELEMRAKHRVRNAKGSR